MECLALSEQCNEWMRVRRTNHNQGLILDLDFMAGPKAEALARLYILGLSLAVAIFPTRHIHCNPTNHFISQASHIYFASTCLLPVPLTSCTVFSPRLGMLLLHTSAGSLFCA